MQAKQLVHVAGWGLGLLAALSASLLGGMYAVLLCGSSLRGSSAIAAFVAVALICFTCIALVLRQLSPVAKLAIAALIFCASFALLPRPSCASEQATEVGC
jgi:hypothetical protein